MFTNHTKNNIIYKEVKLNISLGEVPTKIYATAQKCRETPMGQQVLPN